MKKAEIKLYILEAIDLSEYIASSVVPGVGSVSYLLDMTYNIFVSDKTVKAVRENEKRTFIDWFSGMPSCFNIEMDNYKQDILLKIWNVEGKEFTNVIYEIFMEMLNEYGIARIR